MNKENLNITLQSNKEYSAQFINLTSPQFIEGFRSIYENVKNNNKVPKLVLKEFQDKLKLIPQWSQNIIEQEYKRIKVLSKCEYFDDLLYAMFATYSQTLLSENKSYNNLNISIPTPEHVIHSCYISIARSIWKKPDIFYHRNSKTTISNNLKDLNKIIIESINSTIRNLLPFKEILENYLENNSKNKISNVDLNSLDNELEDYVEEDNDVGENVEDDNDVEEDNDVEDDNDVEEDNGAEEENVEEDNDVEEENGAENNDVGENVEEDNDVEENVEEDNDVEEDNVGKDNDVEEDNVVKDNDVEEDNVVKDNNNLSRENRIKEKLKKKKKNSKKIKRYLGVPMEYKDFKKNKNIIKKNLLHQISI